MSTSVSPLPLPLLPTPHLSPSHLDPATLLTRQDIERHLSSLTSQESELDSRLSGLISSRSRLTSQLKALESLREVVGGIQGEAAHMAAEIGAVAETAERVGAKVRGLDEEQVRILPLPPAAPLTRLTSELVVTVKSESFDRRRASGARPEDGHRKSRPGGSEARLGSCYESYAESKSYRSGDRVEWVRRSHCREYHEAPILVECHILIPSSSFPTAYFRSPFNTVTNAIATPRLSSRYLPHLLPIRRRTERYQQHQSILQALPHDRRRGQRARSLR